jgi:hypothetical protein
MAKRHEISYGRYRIIAGEHKQQPTAVAYFKNSKVLEQTGTDIEVAILSAKTALDAFDKSRSLERRAPHIGTADEYVEAFDNIKLGDHELLMLQAHATVSGQSITATNLAKAAGYDSFSSANAHYGTLAKKVGDSIGLKAEFYETKGEVRYTTILASGEGEEGEHWHWVMHPEVLEALKKLNII